MNAAMAPIASQSGSEIFDRILSSPSGLVVLETTEVHELIGQFQSIARNTGQSIYVWQPDTGLSSLRDAYGSVPDCQRLGNALRYMQQSMHFGIYFIIGLELPLSAMDDTLLRQLALSPQEHLRRVVLMGVPVALAKSLGNIATLLDGEDSRPRHLRLRDGRWIG